MSPAVFVIRSARHRQPAAGSAPPGSGSGSPRRSLKRAGVRERDRCDAWRSCARAGTPTRQRPAASRGPRAPRPAYQLADDQARFKRVVVGVEAQHRIRRNPPHPRAVDVGLALRRCSHRLSLLGEPLSRSVAQRAALAGVAFTSELDRRSYPDLGRERIAWPGCRRAFGGIASLARHCLTVRSDRGAIDPLPARFTTMRDMCCRERLRAARGPIGPLHRDLPLPAQVNWQLPATRSGSRRRSNARRPDAHLIHSERPRSFAGLALVIFASSS